MSEEFNPYLAPQSDLSVAPESVDLYVEGKDLICRDGAALPARCIKTNEPIEPELMKPKTLYWMNPWFYLLILIHFLILIIVYFCVRTRVKFVFGMSPATRKKRALHMLGFWIVFLASLCALFGGVLLGYPLISIASVVALIASLIWLAKIGSVLRVKRQLPNGFFALRGCCPEFLATIEQERLANPYTPAS